MFKSICISILLTGTAFSSFCQDLEQLNKKELRVFLNQKIIVIDSLINKIVSKHIQLLEQVNLNTNLYILVSAPFSLYQAGVSIPSKLNTNPSILFNGSVT